MFQFRWLRRFVRRHTNPIPIDKARSTKSKLSVIYMLVAWNAFGMVCYMMYTGKTDWAHYYGYKSTEELSVPPAKQWAKTLKIDKAKVIRISGLQVEGEYEVDTSKEETNSLNKPDTEDLGD